jgi:hypothetical protein
VINTLAISKVFGKQIFSVPQCQLPCDENTRRRYLMKKALKNNVAPVLVHPSLLLAIELLCCSRPGIARERGRGDRAKGGEIDG